ncbi:hypothetical protein [Oceanisphaera sediminis]
MWPKKVMQLKDAVTSKAVAAYRGIRAVTVDEDSAVPGERTRR